MTNRQEEESFIKQLSLHLPSLMPACPVQESKHQSTNEDECWGGNHGDPLYDLFCCCLRAAKVHQSKMGEADEKHGGASRGVNGL
jgi:hypothetical protein